mmetsp:Transcript_620/g.782  ORF Transcript_620/g.782 Transcript_620/m.782 type:complete len:341 (+) Transcript_620:158-1180(+)
MGGKKNKKKVVPSDGANDMSQEEKQAEQLAKNIRKAQDYMNDRHRTKLLKTYPVGGGLIPWAIVQFLPQGLTKVSPVLFGKPSEMNIKGVPAAALRMLKLSSIMVLKIRKVFLKIDFDDSGYITIGQLMDFTKGKDTLFIRGLLKQTLLSYGPTKMDSMLNFVEFFTVVMVLCTYSNDQVLHIVFQMFDSDACGYIDSTKLSRLISALGTSGGGFGGNAKSMVKGVDKNGDDMLNFNEFMSLYRTNPMVFYPAYKLQEALRKETLTESKWRYISNNWDKKEKDRCLLLKKDPVAFSTQIVELSKWLEEQKQKQKDAKTKNAKFKRATNKAGKAVIAFKKK